MSKKEKDTEIKETEAVTETAEETSAPAEETAAPAEEKAPKEPKNFKKLKYGSMSAVTIVLVIAVVVILNIMCSILTKRYPIKLDFTPDSRYELSDESISVLKDMDKTVDVTVTCSRDYFEQLGEYYKSMYYNNYGVLVECPFEIIPEMLDRYSVYAEQGKGSINVTYIDIKKNPDAVAELSQNYNGEISDGNIVFRCGNRVKVLSQNDVINMVSPSQNSTNTGIDTSFTGEAKLTGAIKSVTDMKPIRTAFITTMSGNSIVSGQDAHYLIIESTKKFLSENGYDCTDVDAADTISPEDYDMIALIAPSIDFSQDIVEKFTDFLYNDGKYGKNMIYIPNFYATNLTNIDEFLADWKIEIDKTAILDDDNSAQVGITALQRIAFAPILTIADSDIVGTLPNNTLPIVAPFGRSISILQSNGTAITTPLLKSSSSSYAQDIIDMDAEPNKDGGFSLVVRSRKETSSEFGVSASNLLVVGCPFMFDTTVIDNNKAFNNANAMLNICNNMTGKEEGVIIPDKAIQQSTLSITSASAKTIQIIVIFVIPALIAIAGVSVLIWRKNK